MKEQTRLLNLSLSRRKFIFIAFSIVSLASIFLIPDQDKINLLLPMYTIVLIGIFTLFSLINREGKLEFFDAGAFLIAITILYSFFPLFSFAMNNFEMTVFVDNRFKEHNMTATKMGSFAWNHVIYLLSLSLSYLYFRPKTRSLNSTNQNIQIPGSAEILIGIVFMAVLSFFQFLIPILFGDSQPYFIKQLNNNFSALFFVMSIWFFAVSLKKWENNLFKFLLVGYFLFEFIKLVLGYSGRTWFALHVLGFGLLYHKLIKPFTTKQIFIYGPIFLIIFLLFGFIRTSQYQAITLGVGFFSGNEEFTAIFATAWELHVLRNELQTLEYIPFAVSTFDFNNLIPSQFLPFEKMAPSEWYLYLKDLQDDGVGFGFGAIAQSIIGWGKLDLLIRGFVTGTFFGLLHKIVNKTSISTWVLVLYVFFALQSYQTFRAGTGYLAYFFFYQFLPCFFLIKFLLISSNPKSRLLKRPAKT